MNSLRHSITLLSVISLLTGCEGYRQAVRNFGHSTGAIMTHDLSHYEAWQNVIYKHGGYTPKQIEVIPCSGFTRLIIHEVRPGEDGLASNLLKLAAEDPNIYGPTDVRTELRH